VTWTGENDLVAGALSVGACTGFHGPDPDDETIRDTLGRHHVHGEAITGQDEYAEAELLRAWNERLAVRPRVAARGAASEVGAAGGSQP